jgi:hypothetical protein
LVPICSKNQRGTVPLIPLGKIYRLTRADKADAGLLDDGHEAGPFVDDEAHRLQPGLVVLDRTVKPRPGTDVAIFDIIFAEKNGEKIGAFHSKNSCVTQKVLYHNIWFGES